jgi:hypothetical protein
MGYATVFQVAAIVIILGSFLSFFIKISKEEITKDHQIIAEG